MFGVDGRDIDGVRDATLREAPPPPALDAPPLGRAPPPARDAPPPARAPPPPPPPRAPPPPPPPPRPPRAHMSLASQTHATIKTKMINNFFMTTPSYVN